MLDQWKKKKNIRLKNEIFRDDQANQSPNLKVIESWHSTFVGHWIGHGKLTSWEMNPLFIDGDPSFDGYLAQVSPFDLDLSNDCKVFIVVIMRLPAIKWAMLPAK